MMTSQHEWNILERDVKQQETNQSINKSINLFKESGILTDVIIILSFLLIKQIYVLMHYKTCGISKFSRKFWVFFSEPDIWMH